MREKKVRVGREKKEEEGDRMSIRKLGRWDRWQQIEALIPLNTWFTDCINIPRLNEAQSYWEQLINFEEHLYINQCQCIL